MNDDLVIDVPVVVGILVVVSVVVVVVVVVVGGEGDAPRTLLGPMPVPPADKTLDPTHHGTNSL